MTGAPPIVTVETVSKRFGRMLALDGVSFDVPQNALVAILGPNGAGKSTLIMILSSLLRAGGPRNHRRARPGARASLSF